MVLHDDQNNNSDKYSCNEYWTELNFVYFCF